jgi:hypothetical protein
MKRIDEQRLEEVSESLESLGLDHEMIEFRKAVFRAISWRSLLGPTTAR